MVSVSSGPEIISVVFTGLVCVCLLSLLVLFDHIFFVLPLFFFFLQVRMRISFEFAARRAVLAARRALFSLVLFDFFLTGRR